MEQQEQFETGQTPSYWASVGIAALIFSLITFILNIIMGYAMIGGNTGWIFTSVSGLVICLIGAFGGMMAVWHYANEYNLTMNLGKGALIGFLTGVAMVIIGIILNEIWALIDPDFTQQIVESTIDRFESMDMPEEQLDKMAQSIKDRDQIGTQLLWGIPIMGVLNLLTGLLGVALFAKEKENDY